MAVNLSADSLLAIGDLIDSRLAAALSVAIAEVEGKIEARVLDRIQSLLDERLAASDIKHAKTILALEEQIDAVSK